MKKLISLVLALAMSISAFAGLSVSAAVTSYHDTAAIEMPANLITNATAFMDGANANNKNKIDNGIIEYKAVSANKDSYSYYVFAGSQKVFSDFASVSLLTAGKTYVYSAKVKNSGTDASLIPYVGISMGSDWAYSKDKTNEYADGMAVTSTEYVDYKATITANTASKGMNLGVSKSSDEGSAVTVDGRNMYFAVEVPFDIAITSASGNVFGVGSNATFNAEVVNQIGITGTLNQELVWAVVDAERTAVVDTITAKADGNTLNITIGEGTADGSYAVVAISDEYNIVKGYEIEVLNDVSASYEDTVPVAMPANLVTSATTLMSGENGGSLDKSQSPITIYKATSSNISNSIYNMYRFAGSQKVFSDFTSASELTQGKTYVYSVKVKNSGSDSTKIPYYGISMGADWAGYKNTTNEYEDGMPVTSTEYVDFKATITATDAAKRMNSGISSKSDLDSEVTVDGTNMYLAEEIPYEVVITPVKAAVLPIGGEASFKSEVVNQIGIPGTIAQGVEWVVLNADRTEVAEGIATSVSGNTITLSCADSMAAGEYTLVAKSTEYGFVKGLKIDVKVDLTSKYEDFEGSMPANLIINQNFRSTINGGGKRDDSVDNQLTYTLNGSNGGTESGRFWKFVGSMLQANNSKNDNIEVGALSIDYFKAGTTYVYKTKVKNANANIIPHYGITYLIDWANGKGSDTYGTEGMAVESTDWVDFKDTITFPADWNEAKTAKDIGQTLHAGIKYNNAEGASVTASTNLNDMYLAEEVLYSFDIIAPDTEIVKGGTEAITLSAELKNQIDLKGGLDQNVEWVALNADRSKEINGFVITDNGDGSVTVNGADAPNGDYVIVAHSDTYKASKGVDITVSEKPVITATAFDILQDSGYAYLNAGVINAECEKVMFGIATYEKQADGSLKLSTVNVSYVDVKNGAAEISDLIVTDKNGKELELADGTVVKAFIWTDDMKPVAPAKTIVVGEEAPTVLTLYASADAEGEGEGTQASPLTFQAAKERAATEKADYADGAEVILLDGEYRLSDTLVFTDADNGVTYKAAGDNAVIKGSAVVDTTKEITDITDTRVKDTTNIKAYDISEHEAFLREWADIDSEKSLANGEMNGVYVNGVEQDLAQWPNGDEYAIFAANSTDNSLVYTGEVPDGWTASVGNFWLGGYFRYDYAYTRKSVTGIDTSTNTITLFKNNNTDGVNGNSEFSHRYKAFNLLEELDAPGEYYIDTQNKILYIYPNGNIEEIELSLSNNALVSVKNASDITFDGINFVQTRGDAVLMNGVNNIAFTNCTFKNIASEAIYTPYEGDNVTKAVTDTDYWQVQPLDVANNIAITGCDFENIGSAAIVLYGGNVDTLTGSQNIVSDNKITTVAQLAKNSSAIRMGGVGNTISNNDISDAPFQAITHFGNDHVIKLNKIHDVIKEADDCAAIYCGRNALQRGTVIENNYIYNLKHSTAPRGFNGAIYWDDRQGGITAKNNIIENVNIGVIINGGVDNVVSDNVFINVTDECTDSEARGAITAIKTANNVYDNTAEGGKTFSSTSLASTKNVYFDKYNTLSTLLGANLERDLSADPGNTVYNKISGNTLVNSDGITAADYSEVSRTATATSYDKTIAAWFANVGLITAR